MPLVIRLRVAGVAEDTGLVRLAGSANPDDVILAECVLAHSAWNVSELLDKVRVSERSGGILPGPFPPRPQQEGREATDSISLSLVDVVDVEGIAGACGRGGADAVPRSEASASLIA